MLKMLPRSTAERWVRLKSDVGLISLAGRFQVSAIRRSSEQRHTLFCLQFR